MDLVALFNSWELKPGSLVEHPLMVQWVAGSIPPAETIELFLVPASAPQVV